MGHAQSTEHSSVKSQSLNHKQSKGSTKQSSSNLSNKDRDNESKTKSKKLTRLGTIRRKLAKSLKTGKNSDFSKHMRGLLQNWTVQQIQELVNQYERFEAIKRLSILSDAAKPDIKSLQQEFLEILDNEVCTDLVIEYNGNLYSLHKSIVSCRCKFFAKYLAAYKNGNDVIKFEIPGLVLDASTFASLLRYIYSGIIDNLELKNILTELTEKFGVLNELIHDLKSLKQSTNHTDVLLVYPNKRGLDNHRQKVIDLSPASTLESKTQEILCHSAVLNARSMFFQSLITRKLKERQNPKDPVRIVLDEKVLPQCYIQVVLLCIYTDNVDLSSVIKWKVAEDGTGEADRLLSTSEMAMELYEIGKFLELSSLVRGCEQIIVENINQLSLVGVLEWSSQPHGSPYILRQSMKYLREEFMFLCKIPAVLCNLPKRFLVAAIKSDYLQSTEEFVLFSIIKWGEWQISKANGKSNNSSPGSSLPRRSPKRREHNSQVRLIISQLIGYVRFRHILPAANSSVLSAAVQRGLVDDHVPFDMVMSSPGIGANTTTTGLVFWLSSYNHPEYQNPRLFTNYLAEAKIILNERLSTDQDTTNHQRPSNLNPGNLPDMLPRDDSYKRPTKKRHRDSLSFGGEYGGDWERVCGSFRSHCELDEDTIRDMVLMEKELKMSPEVIDVISLVPDCKYVSEEIQLRVVRRFGLPDEMASEVFGQAPDLVDSGGSSYSSKQNTLSRVGRILQEDDSSPIGPVDSLLCQNRHQRTASLCSAKANSTIPRNSSNTISRISISMIERTSIGRRSTRLDSSSLTRSRHGSADSSRNNTMVYAGSPLDLPLLQQQQQAEAGSLPRDLPNVLLDT